MTVCCGQAKNNTVFDKIKGQSEDGESIYPEKSLTELLVFELPIDKANEIRFELPAEAIGEEGLIRFRGEKSLGKDQQMMIVPFLTTQEREAIAKEKAAQAKRELESEERAKKEQAAAMAKKAEEDKKAAAALLISQGKADAEWAVFQKRLDSAKAWDDSMKKTADGIDKKYPGTKRPEKTELEIDAYPKLRLALQVHRSNTDVGRKRLSEIIKDFPGTLAARQAEKTIGK